MMRLFIWPPLSSKSSHQETIIQSTFGQWAVILNYSHFSNAFIFQPSSSGYLNLEFAACDNVHISYKAITKLDKSLYSPIKVETIKRRSYTEGYPSQVHYSDIQTYFREDFRDGYIGHALATFSWPKPESEIN